MRRIESIFSYLIEICFSVRNTFLIVYMIQLNLFYIQPDVNAADTLTDHSETQEFLQNINKTICSFIYIYFVEIWFAPVGQIQ